METVQSLNTRLTRETATMSYQGTQQQLFVEVPSGVKVPLLYAGGGVFIMDTECPDE